MSNSLGTIVYVPGSAVTYKAQVQCAQQEREER